MRPLIAALLILALAASPASASSLPSTPDAYPWTVDGSVLAMARSGDTMYLGGDFTYLGPRTGPLALLDGTGAPDADFPRVDDGFVNAVAADGSGGWYVGGYFQEQGSNLFHVLADGQVDPDFVSALDGEVRELALVGGTLYVAGGFTQGLVALNSDGTMTGWNPAPTGECTRSRRAAARSTSAATSPTIAGQPRAGLAAFSGGTLTAWAPQLDQPHVRALETSGTRLYVSGQFTAVGGTPRSRLAAFSLAGGSLDAGWAPPAQDAFEQLTYADGERHALPQRQVC